MRDYNSGSRFDAILSFQSLIRHGGRGRTRERQSMVTNPVMKTISLSISIVIDVLFARIPTSSQ